MEDSVLRVVDLVVSFRLGERRLRAVRGLSFGLKRGELLAVVGESGSGKSVTAMSLIGLNGDQATTSGGVWFGERLLSDMKPRELRELRRDFFGVIFQEPSSSFDPIYTIGRCFWETFRTKSPKISLKESDKRAVALLQEVHIRDCESRLKNYPHQFSGGMLQRVMIALSLANNPEVLIADEPTTALDVTIQAEIIRLLMELKEKRALSILFITHDLALVSGIADEIMVMYGGLILERGSVDGVVNCPKSPYTAALLMAMPDGESHYRNGPLYSIPGNVPDPLNPLPGCPFAPRCDRMAQVCVDRLPPFDGEVRCFFPLNKKGAVSGFA